MKRRNFIGCSLLFVAGCTAATSNPNNSSENSAGSEPEKLPANGSSDNSAGSRPEKLRLAVTEAPFLEQLQREYGLFRTALEEVLEKKIEFFLIENHLREAAVPALQSDQVDLVLAGPSEYVLIHAKTNAVPVIALTRPKYYSVIAVRADSGIKSVAQLKGKSIAMGDLNSTSAHLGPIKLLMDAGLNPQSDVKILMLGVDMSVEAFKNGDVDAWAGRIRRYEKLLKAEGLSENAFPLIVKGPPLPNDVFIASNKLDPDKVEEIRDRILKHQDKLIQSLLPVDDGRYKNIKLVSANDADYNMIREVYKAIDFVGEYDLS